MAEHCIFQGDYYELHLSGFIERPWTLMEPIFIGEVPSGRGTPDCYCSVERNLEPAFLINIYEAPFNVQATFWHTWLVISSQYQIHFISLEKEEEQASFILGNFCCLYTDKNYLLVCSLTKVFCFDKELQKHWESPEIGLDGVEVISVEGERVLGQVAGYFDDWKPFVLSLATGEVIQSPWGHNGYRT